MVSNDVLAEALAEIYPPKNPEDIETWTAEELDELALIDLFFNEDDLVEVDELGLNFIAPHGDNTEDEKLMEV